MMKRFLNVFLSLLLLFTSVFVANNRIYAQDEDFTTDEETEVLVEETVQDEQEEVPEEFSFEQEDETDEKDQAEPVDLKSDEPEEALDVEEEAQETKIQEEAQIQEEGAEEEEETYDDPSTCTSITKDPETGDLQIRSKCTEWLYDIYNKYLNGYGLWFHFEGGKFVPFNANYPYVDSDFDGEDLIGFTITHEALLANHIPSNCTFISTPSTSSFPSFNIDIDFEFDACTEVPEGLIVEETPEGIKFYYEQTNDENQTFLQSLLIAKKYRNHKVVSGSGIGIIDSNSENYLHAENYQEFDDESGAIIHDSREIDLSDDGSYALITHEYILNSNLFNTDQTLSVNIDAYGYLSYSTELNGLRYANEPLPEDLEITIDFDGDGALIIKANDEDWLEAACKLRRYTENGVNLEDGSTLSIYSSSSGNRAYFYNQQYVYNNNPEITYELKTDDNGEKYIYISKANVLRRFSKNGVSINDAERYYIQFNTVGYQNYSSDSDGKYFSFPEGYCVDASESISIYQDEETHDLWVTSTDAGWLAEQYSLSYSSTYYYLYFNNGYSISYRENNGYISFVKENGEIKGFYITYDALLANFVASGENVVYFPATENYAGVNFDLNFELVACKKVPEGLKAEETPEGIKLFYEEPTEEQLDFLSSLTKTAVYENNSGKEIASGSYVSVGSLNNSIDNQWAQISNIRYVYGGTDEIASETNNIVLSDDGTYVLVLNKALKGSNSTLYNSDQVYQIQIRSYGYVYNGDTRLNGLRYVNSRLSDDFYITIDFDDEGGMIIRSNDEEWLNAVVKPRVYENNRLIEEGSYLNIYNSETGRSIYFGNETSSNGWSNEYLQLNTDEEGKQYIYISHADLIERFSSNGDSGNAQSRYWIKFTTYGYQNYNSLNDDLYFSFPNDLLKTVDIEIEENDHGDLVISGDISDSNYLSFIDKIANDRNNSYFDFQSVDKNIWYNTYWSDEGVYINGNKQLIISQECLFRGGIPNGEVAIVFYADGFARIEKTIVLTQACQETPAEISYTFTEEGDLVISSGDPNWIDRFKNENSSISIYNNKSGSEYIYVNLYYKNYYVTVTDDQIIIDSDFFANRGFSSGFYTIRFKFYGYGQEDINNVLFGNYVNEVKAEITVVMVDGDLVISCDDTDFLDALVIPSIEEKRNGIWNTVLDGSYVNISDDLNDHMASISNYKQINYDTDYTWERNYLIRSGKTVKVSNADLSQYRNLYDCNNAKVELFVPGYGTYIVSGVKIEGVRSTDVPETVDIYQDEEGNVIISSSYSQWLKALCVPYKYSNTGNTQYGGYISFTKLEENGSTNYSRTCRNYEGSTNLRFVDDNVIISYDWLISNNFGAGNYNVYFYADKYKLVVSENVTFAKACKEFPNSVRMELSESGDLYIYGDEDFLEAMAAWTSYDNKGNLISSGSYIDAYDKNYSYKTSIQNYSYKNTIINQIEYDKANNRVVISRKHLEGFSGNGYRLRFYPYGYESKDLTMDFPLISVPSATMVVGSSMQFNVNAVYSVTWSVDNEELAEVDSNGLLVAKGIGEVRLSARIEGVDRIDSILVSIIPPGGVSFKVTPAKKDVAVGDTCQLEAVYDKSLGLKVNYSSSDVNIATVDENGLVSFLEAGQVTITSTLYEGKSASSVFTVYPVEKGNKLTATIEGYNSSVGIEALDKVSLAVKAGGELVDAADLEFSSGNEVLATVDESGLISTLKPGTVKITAKLKNDPSKRSVTFSLKIYARIVSSLDFELQDETHVIDSYEYDETNDVLYIYMDVKKALKSSFRLLPSGIDKLGDKVEVASVTYAPIDTSVLSVASDGTVSIKKSGQTAIKAMVSSNPKGSDPVTAQVIVRIIDYTPVLEAAKITVNRYYDEGSDINIHAVNGSSIESVSLINSKTNEVDFNTRLLDGGHVIITPTAAVKESKAKSYNETLIVKLAGKDEPYEFKYTVAVSTTLPKTKVKTSGTYNTVLDVNTLALDIQCDTPVRDIEFVDNWASIKDGKIQLSYNEKGNLILKGAVKIFFEGYSGSEAFVKSNITFKSEKTLPSAAVSAENASLFNKNTLILNTAFLSQYDLLLTSSDEAFPIENIAIKESYEGLSLSYDKQTGKLQVFRDMSVAMKNAAYKFTITPYISAKGMAVALKNITLTVKLSDALPKASLSASSVKLNKRYDEIVTLDVKLSDLPAGVEIESFRTNSLGDDVLNGIEYDAQNNTVNLSLKDRDKTAVGTYKYELYPEYSGNVEGSAIKLTISVIDKEAKATISIKGSLNQMDPLSDTNCLGTVKLTDVSGNVSSVETDSENIDVILDENSQVVFTLKKQDLKDQTLKDETVKVVLDNGAQLTAKVNVKVARKAPVLKLSETKLNVYDTSYQNIEVGRIALTELPYGQIKAIWFSPSMVYELSYDEANHKIVVVLKDAANMKAGASSNITIKVDYVGDYGTYEQSLTDKSIKGLKTTTLKLVIKDASGTVKAK